MRVLLRGGIDTLSALPKLVAKILITVLLGGFLGATLVRFAPGFGVDEEELDSRLSAQSIQALRETRAEDANIFVFYFHYLSRLLARRPGNLADTATPGSSAGSRTLA